MSQSARASLARPRPLTQSLCQFHAHRILKDIGRGSEQRKRFESRNIGMELGGHDLAEPQRANSADLSRIFGTEDGFNSVVA